MKVASFQKTDVRAISDDAEAALKEVAAKYGLAVSVGTRRYSAKDMRFKVEMVVVEEDESGEAETPEALAFKRKAHLYGMTPEMLGKVFKTYKGYYKITGLKPRNKKYPVLAENPLTGTTYKFAAAAVALYFKSFPLNKEAQ
jgi:hypothetical protein